MPERQIDYQFNREKFEEIVYQKERSRVISIKKYKRSKRINALFRTMIVLLMVYTMAVGLITITTNIYIKKQENDISKLETVLYKKKAENEQLSSKLSEIVIDKGIRERAILELSMTVPTERNVIYFDKTDRGYVHYDK